MKLLLAQLLNFGILAFLLTKFLFRPMIKVLDARVETAKRIETEAEELAESRRDMEQWRAQQEREAREQADTILKKATGDAETLRQQTVLRTEEDIVRLKEKTSKELEQQRHRVFQEAQSELAGLALLASEKILGREANRADTDRLVKEAMNEMPQ